MATYIIHELQNLESVRKGEIFEGTLRAAKAKASREQMWQGTVLKITDEQGRTVATKDRQTGRWYDAEY
ncbi:MAG: hypothetical protein RBT67_07765 [Thauera sp.]|jgi:hypothetical protein|nr:hypothetical protein [Thauera sp.]